MHLNYRNISIIKWFFIIGLGIFHQVSNGQNVEFLHQYGTKSQSEIIIATSTNSSGYINSIVHYFYDTNSNPRDTLYLGDSAYYYPQFTKSVSPHFIIQHDRNGKLVRSKYIGTFGASLLATDENDNIYIYGLLTAKNKIVGNDTLDHYNGAVILAKYDKYLNELWHVQSGEDSASFYINRLKWSNGHLYFIIDILADATIGNVHYTVNQFYYHIFGEIDTSNGNYLWSKAMPERTQGLGGIFLTDIIRFSNSNVYISGYTAFGDYVINGDSFNKLSGFVIKTDSVGNYEKRYLLIGKSARIINDLGSPNTIFSLDFNNSKLFLSCSISDDIIWKGNWLHKQIDTIGLESILIALNPDLDEQFYYRPMRKLNIKRKYHFCFFKISYSNGFLYGMGNSSYNLQFDSFQFKDISDSTGLYMGGLFIFKLDTLGKLIWGLDLQKGQEIGANYRQYYNPNNYYYFYWGGGYGYGGYGANWYNAPLLMNDKSEMFLSGCFEDSVNYGQLKRYTKGGFDAFFAKVSENEIRRQYMKNIDYCAGDTFEIPFTTKGLFDSINYFVAELSNENGIFDKDARRLGAVKANKDSSIWAVLPLKNLKSSHNYRIRIRSTWPAVENDYMNDTFRFTIYSKDKAYAGSDTMICPGDSARLYALGGTGVVWQPNVGLSSNTKRLTSASPTVTTQYMAIVEDSSGCSARDTAYKMVFVKPSKINLSSRDTIICVDDTLPITANFEGADTTAYKWKWWLIEFGYYNLIQTGAKRSTDRLNFSFDQGYNVKIGITLDNGCPRDNYDTVEIKVSLPSALKISAHDMVSCVNEPLILTAVGTGGIKPHHQFHWQQLSPSKIIGTGDSVPYATDKTTSLMVVLSDGCMEKEDTQYVQITMRAPLQASSNLRDSTLCYGQSLSYTATGTGGDTTNHQYRWMLNTQQVGMGKTLTFNPQTYFSDTGGSKTLQLIFGDGCTAKSDTQWAKITLLPKLKQQITGKDTLCYGQLGQVIRTTTGGTGTYTKQWQNQGGQMLGSADSLLLFHNQKQISGTQRYISILGDGCSTADTAQFAVEYLKPLVVSISAQDSCLKTGTTLQATAQGGKSAKQIQWYQEQAASGTGNTLAIPLPNRETTYKAAATDACSLPSDTAIQRVSPFPKIQTSLSPNQGCDPLTVTFTSQRQNGTNNQYRYTVGNATRNWSADSSFVYMLTAGTYSAKVEVQTALGCSDTFNFAAVEVFSKPKAQFSYFPKYPTPKKPQVHFNNLSTGATSFIWNFGATSSAETEPVQSFASAGLQTIVLTAISDKGCLDTATDTLRIYEDYGSYIPNAFTPNNDGLNEIFIPIMVGTKTFELTVFNRWGQMVFRGENEGWNGLYNGKPVPEGMYIYHLRFTAYNTDEIEEQGTVMVLKAK